MAYHIYPTETPVGSFLSSPSNYVREYQLVQHMLDVHACQSDSFVCWQYDLSIGSGLSVNVSLGVAVVSGFRVATDAIVNVSGLAPSTTNYVYLQLVKTGSLVTSAQMLANTTGTLPTDSVLLGRAITGGSTVTSVDSSIKKPGSVYSSSYVGNGDSTRLIFLGITPKLVYVDGAGFSNVFGGTNGVNFSYSDNHVYQSSDSHVVPILGTYGFTVNNGGSPSLNTTSTTYRYIAWF